jgi:urease accessory protein
MLAMVAVGFAGSMLAVRGTKSALLAPLAFMLAMTAGALGAWGGMPVGWSEAGILASIGAAAALVFFGARLGAPAVIGLAALCGLPHGAAHGVELAQSGDALAGFLLATGLLHGVGLAAGLAAMRLVARGGSAVR